MIERRYREGFVAKRASREKQIQQHYRPVISVHKWFARRPGSLFWALTLAEFADTPLTSSFEKFHAKVVAGRVGYLGSANLAAATASAIATATAVASSAGLRADRNPPLAANMRR